MAARAQGEYTPSEPESSSEDEEEEGEVDPPPLSPLHETLSPFEDIISRQGGGSQSACVSRSGLRQRLGHRPTCPNNPVSRWYLLTQGGRALCLC
jgi:hypothetical protein